MLLITQQLNCLNCLTRTTNFKTKYLCIAIDPNERPKNITLIYSAAIKSGNRLCL